MNLKCVLNGVHGVSGHGGEIFPKYKVFILFLATLVLVFRLLMLMLGLFTFVAFSVFYPKENMDLVNFLVNVGSRII